MGSHVHPRITASGTNKPPNLRQTRGNSMPTANKIGWRRARLLVSGGCITQPKPGASALATGAVLRVVERAMPQ